VAAIKPNIVFTDTISGNPAAEVEVRAGPSGSIIARRIVRSSGNKDWDEAVLRAIDRTATLPRDVDGRVPSAITMVFRPQE
jgi:colicin import membrane protein